MIKMVHLLRRRESVSAKAFRSWWRTDHATLIREQQAVRHKARYTQLHTIHPVPPLAGLEGAATASDLDYDGISESWYEDTEDKQRRESSAAGTTAATAGRADHAPYIDSERSLLQVPTTERLVAGSMASRSDEPSAVVIVDCLWAAPGVSLDEVFEWCTQERAAILGRLSVLLGFLRHTQSLVDAEWAAEAAERESFIGLDEVAWASLAQLREATASRAWAEACTALDEGRDLVRRVRLVAEELVFIDGGEVLGDALA